MHLFTLVQVVCFAVIYGVTWTPAAIVFPIFILLLVPLRRFLLPRWFAHDALQELDGAKVHMLTAADLARLEKQPAPGTPDQPRDSLDSDALVAMRYRVPPTFSFGALADLEARFGGSGSGSGNGGSGAGGGGGAVFELLSGRSDDTGPRRSALATTPSAHGLSVSEQRSASSSTALLYAVAQPRGAAMPHSASFPTMPMFRCARARLRVPSVCVARVSAPVRPALVWRVAWHERALTKRGAVRVCGLGEAQWSAHECAC